jgi:hypothetical protein
MRKLDIWRDGRLVVPYCGPAVYDSEFEAIRDYGTDAPDFWRLPDGMKTRSMESAERAADILTDPKVADAVRIAAG